MGYLIGGLYPYHMWSSGVLSGLGIDTAVSPTRFIEPHTGKEEYFYDTKKEALKERASRAEEAFRQLQQSSIQVNSLEDIKPIGINKNKKLLLI